MLIIVFVLGYDGYINSSTAPSCVFTTTVLRVLVQAYNVQYTGAVHYKYLF